MKRIVRILIVDDHPATISGYELWLQIIDTAYHFETEEAKSCDEVLEKMRRHKGKFYDIVLLDISLPASVDESVINGEGLGLKIQQKFPDTKIIVHTALSIQERITNIFQSLNPDGFIIKSDLEPNVLQDAINSVLSGHTYYSEQTNRLIGHNSDDFFLDSSDIKILYHLSKGTRMKNLPNYVPLAMATIERRKKKLKMLFGISDRGNRELLDIARAKGFI